MSCSYSNGSYNYPSDNSLRYTQGTQMQGAQMQNTQLPSSQMMPGTQMPGTQPLSPNQALAAKFPKSTRSNMSTVNAGTNSVLQTGTMIPTTVENPYYTAGILTRFIGENMRVEFLIGTSGTLTDRIGKLIEVGASYIILQLIETDDLLICDLYSIKFVNIYR